MPLPPEVRKAIKEQIEAAEKALAEARDAIDLAREAGIDVLAEEQELRELERQLELRRVLLREGEETKE